MMVADLWVPDDQDAGLITRQAPFDEVRRSAQRTTFSMAQDAHERLAAGSTTLEELLRVLPYSAIAEHRARFSGSAPPLYAIGAAHGALGAGPTAPVHRSLA
jgi:hypothetical protein